MSTKTVRSKRFSSRSGPDPDDDRKQFAKDCDHILYSSAFRRLDGVTQVVASSEMALFHNRLTHSLKVAQVGGRIFDRLDALRKDDTVAARQIERFGGLDSRVVRAACLAHDLGHPPFGHVAEEALQQILSAKPDQGANGVEIHPPLTGSATLEDSFEGNAQSFRIVTRLAFREAVQDGPSAALDLTKATLAALQKYPWLKTNRPEGIDRKKMKWGAYESERELLSWAMEGIEPRPVMNRGENKIECRTVEAQVMDWADDITYAIHDVEDFFRAGLIPMDVLARDDGQFGEFLSYAWPKISPIVGHVMDRAEIETCFKLLRGNLFPQGPYTGSREDRQRLHFFATSLISPATENLQVADGGVLMPDRDQLVIIEVLKQLTPYYVIERPSLGSAQRGQVYLIRELFRDLTSWVNEALRPQNGAGEHPLNSRRRALPPRLVDYVEVAFDNKVGCTDYADDQRVCRAVVDYIVSLTEAQAIELSSRLSGRTGRSILEGWHQM